MPRRSVAKVAPQPADIPDDAALRYRSRILRLEWVDPKTLIPHPENPRYHPGDQLAAIRDGHEEIGIIEPIYAAHPSRHVIDGHGRLQVALDDGLDLVQVAWLDLPTPQDEINALVLMNTVRNHADTDADRMGALLASFDGGGSEALAALVDQSAADLAAAAEQLERETDDLGDASDLEGGDPSTEEQYAVEDAPDTLPGILGIKEGMEFPGDSNPWQIADLRADMLAEIPPNLHTWAGVDATPDADDPDRWWLYNFGSDSSRGLPRDRTLLAFYVEDYRFQGWAEKPVAYISKMLNAGIRLAITPNFSLWGDEPTWRHLQSTAQARHVGRYMQESGIRIIPDVAWSNETSFPFCLFGIPRGAPAVSIQLQTSIKDAIGWKVKVLGLKAMMRELQPRSLLIYGKPGAEKVAEEAGVDVPVVFVPNRVAVRRATMDRFKKPKKSAAPRRKT